MKKILLSCVTCLLALGLVTACDDEVEDVTPEDPNAGVVEPGGDEGGGTSGGGSGDTSTGSGHYVGKEVSEYVSGESYLLGMVTADGKTHYGTGEMSGYYGATTTDYEAANSYTITDVDGGVTLSTVVEGKTVYVTMAASDGHYNLVYSETAQVLTYDSEYNTFTITTQVEVTNDDDEPADDDETQDPVYEDYTLFLGTYGDYSTLGWYNYAWISQSGEYPAHLYELVELSNPTSISVTGEETSVEEGKTIQLTASVTPADAYSEVVWSTSDEKVATVSESGLVTGVAVGNATITASSVTASAVSGSIVITVTEVAPLPEGMIGYFDFSECTENSTSITSFDALDEYWTGESGFYEGAREHDAVYLGNGSGGEFANVTTCLKFGVGDEGGVLQLKFTIGTVITGVTVTAHSWDKSAVTTLTINDVTQDCSISGEPEELTYEFTGNPTNLVTMKTEARVTVHSIDIYGYYDESVIADVESLTLSADSEEAMNIGETRQVYVSWTPEDKEFDIDTLAWESDDESVAIVEQNKDGALITSVGEGSATITATAANGVSDTIDVKIEDVLEESETFVASTLGYENEEVVKEIDGHQIAITFDAGTNSNSDSPKYYTSGTAIRVYSNNTITFTPTYVDKGVTISTIEIVCNGTYYGNEYMTFTDANGDDAGTLINPRQSECTITLTPDVDGAVTLTNWRYENHSSANGGTQLRIVSITINYTLNK